MKQILRKTINHFQQFNEKIKKHLEKKIEQENLYYQDKHKRKMTPQEMEKFKFQLFMIYTVPFVLIILFIFSFLM